MKIVGLLAWFDESPTWLAACVAGFGRVCDTIVAVDGAYALYPGGRARSHPNQAEAILSAAEAAGAGCIIHRPQTVFYGNEVEKRNQSLALAGALCEEGEDWVFVFDADCHVLHMDDRRVRAELEQTDLHVATMTLVDGTDLLTTASLAQFARDHDAATEWANADRALFRWTPTLRYGPTHYCVGGDYDGGHRWVRGAYDGLLDTVDFGGSLVVYHRTQERAKVRRDAAAGYYQNREAAGIERHEALT